MTQQTPVALVVEDEDLLRLLAVDLVEDAGLVPLVAKNADQAIAILEEHPDISLLFTDIHMPGSMDGLNLAHAVPGTGGHQLRSSSCLGKSVSRKMICRPTADFSQNLIVQSTS